MANPSDQRPDPAGLAARVRALLHKVTDLVDGQTGVDLLQDLGVGDDLDSLALGIHILAQTLQKQGAADADDGWRGAPCGHALLGADGRIVRANDTFATLLGQPPTALIGARLGPGWADAGMVYAWLRQLTVPESAVGAHAPRAQFETVTGHGATRPVWLFAWAAAGGAGWHLMLVDPTTLRAHPPSGVYAAERRPSGALAAETVPQPPQPAPARDKPSSGQVPARPLQVLVVDDDPIVRSVTSELLEACGFQPTVLASGAQALAFFEQAEHAAVDVLLVDLSMPQMTGPQLVERLGARVAGTPLVFMTGYLDPEQATSLQANHGALVLRKPFALADLVSTLYDAVGAGPRVSREPKT